MTNEELINLSESPDQDWIHFNQLSFFSAKPSAGAAIETCKAVLDRKVKNANAVRSSRRSYHSALLSLTVDPGGQGSRWSTRRSIGANCADCVRCNAWLTVATVYINGEILSSLVDGSQTIECS